MQRSWNCPNVLVVATRGLGKSTVIDLILMSKGMLFNNFWSYIASGSGGQAEQTFTTLERLANDNIDEMVGSTGYIFKNEVEIKMRQETDLAIQVMVFLILYTMGLVLRH